MKVINLTKKMNIILYNAYLLNCVFFNIDDKIDKKVKTYDEFIKTIAKTNETSYNIRKKKE